MKKFLAIVSLVMVAAMLAITPAFALESDVPSLAVDYSLDAANGVKVVAVPAGAKTPVADGVIEDGEYSYSFKEDRTPISLTSASHNAIAADYNVNVNAEVAKKYVDMTPIILDTEVEYFFAQDDDYIYVGVKYKPGVDYEKNADGSIATESYEGTTFKKYKSIMSRANTTYRFGFNLDDADEYIEMHNNGERFDLTSDAVSKKFMSAGVGVDIVYDGVIEQAYRQIVALETGWLNHTNDAGITMEGDIIDQFNPATEYVVTDEIAISKAALLQCMSDYSGASYDAVPNAFFFQMCSNGQVIGATDDAGTRGWTSTGGAGFYMWNGAKTNGTEVSLREVFPDLIVFTDDATVTKDSITVAAAAETEAPETEAPAADETEAPAADETEAPAADDTAAADDSAAATTEAPAAAGGCGGTVSVAGLALVAALGSCALFVEKKRK